jgi:hypothetical protein
MTSTPRPDVCSWTTFRPVRHVVVHGYVSSQPPGECPLFLGAGCRDHKACAQYLGNLDSDATNAATRTMNQHALARPKHSRYVHHQIGSESLCREGGHHDEIRGGWNADCRRRGSNGELSISATGQQRDDVFANPAAITLRSYLASGIRVLLTTNM